MRYLSVCSGIEAATVAWHRFGWEPVAFSEIEAFPSAVLAHHYPNVREPGGHDQVQEWPDADVDVLVGGTPCQSFSVAGLRKGLDDPRGNLMLTFLAIARRYRPRWIVWENVPGVLSSTEDGTLEPFSGAWANSGMGGPTECWTLSMSEHPASHTLSHSDGVVCSLSDVLETGAVPQRFFLSPKACKGILRRAEKRGKSLPPSLAEALRAVASGQISTATED
jgi:hypothetical protein